MGEIIFLALFLSPLQDRVPMPTAEEIKRAESDVRSTLAKDYAVKDRTGRRLLAAKLLDQANGATIPAEHYVLLRDAAEIAASTIDHAIWMNSIQKLCGHYDVSPYMVYLGSLTTARKGISTPEEAASVAEMYLSAWESATLYEEHDIAAEWATEAAELAKKANDPLLRQAAEDMAKDAVEAKRMKERKEASDKILSAKPGDETASLEIGLYLSAVKSDWSRALALLAAGPEGPLRDQAKKDLGKGLDPEIHCSIADGWILLASKEKLPLLKRAYESRAKQLQEDAYRSSTGLAKTRISKKVSRLSIVKATYGVGSKAADITSVITEAFEKDPWAAIRAGDELAGSSPVSSNDVLTIHYQIGERRMMETVKKWQVLVLPHIPEKGVIVPGASRSFKIISSHLGIGAKMADVTPSVRKHVTTPYAIFHGGMGGFDPNPGVVKTAVIQFECHGRRFMRYVRDGESIRPMEFK